MNANEDVCIYDKPFWLDAVCGKDKWDAVLLEENQQIVAAVPYHKKKRLGIRYFMQPKLTQYFDIWINPMAERKTERYIHYQFQMIEEITKGLLEVGADYYFQMYSPKLHNWEPFCWEGFHQETRYTFRISPNRSIEDIEAQMSARMRDEIKQAAKKAVITELKDVDVFCQYQEYAFSRKNMKNPFPKALVRSIYSACKEQNACKMLAVKEDDSICCVGLYVFDNNYVYDITLEDAAALSGFSKFHFSRLFKEYMNCTFYDYLINQRIKATEVLLTDDRLSITDIALQAGFSSISTFNRTFKQKKGCTPGEYRALYSGGLGRERGDVRAK
jgi:AraC-like DNA-binding protein